MDEKFANKRIYPPCRPPPHTHHSHVFLFFLTHAVSMLVPMVMPASITNLFCAYVFVSMCARACLCVRVCVRVRMQARVLVNLGLETDVRPLNWKHTQS